MKYDVLIKKCGRSLEVDAGRFSATVQSHIFEYGLRQKLNDSIASFKADEADMDEAFEHVQSVVNRLYDGDIRAHRAGGGFVQTPETIAKSLALRKVCNVWLKKNKGKKLTEYAARNDDAASELDANRAKYLAVAQAQFELMAEAVD
jgi:hypothetical protein